MYLINAFVTGGAELIVCRLAPLMRDYGYAPLVVALADERDDPGRAARADLEASGIRTETIGKPPGNRRIGALSACIRLVRCWKPAIVHTHCDSPDFFGGLASMFGPARHISTLATIVRPTSAARIAAWRLVDLAARTHYIAISEAVARSWQEHRGLGRGRITVVPNGVDPGCFGGPLDLEQARQELLHVNPGQRVVLAVGRLHPAKDFPCLIEAFATLAARHPDLHLAILGEGPERAALEQLVAKKALGNRISLPGTSSRIPDAMRTADLLVVPSAWEGFGLVAVEGLMAGLPVIVSDVGGLGEMAQNGAPMVTFPAGDAAALSQRIEELLASPTKMEQLSRAAGPWAVEHYSLDAMASGYAAVYHHLLVL